MPPLTKAPTSVYRLFDLEGHLLYVGITAKGIGRLEEHARGKGWWADVATAQVVHCPTRKQAMIIERLAVETEHPLHNLYLRPKRPKAPKEKVASVVKPPKTPKPPRPASPPVEPRLSSESARLLRALPRAPRNHVCPVCGTTFEGQGNRATFCSAKCRWAEWSSKRNA